MSEILVDVNNLSKKFSRDYKRSLIYGVQDVGRELVGLPVKPDLRPKEFWALQDISFQLQRGESLGIIGANGAGKTTLLKLLNGLIKPTSGDIRMRGRVQAMIALNAGVSNKLSGRENIYVNAATFGIPKREVDEIIEDIIAFAEIGDFIDTPMRNYSSGMKVRLGFSVAIHVKPDVLIIDEVLSVGDSNFRRKARNAMGKLLADDVALIFISHNTHEVIGITQRALWLDKGREVMIGESTVVCGEYEQMQYDRSVEGESTQYTFKYSNKRTGDLEVDRVSLGGVPLKEERHIEIDFGAQESLLIDIDLHAKDALDEEAYHLWSLESIEGERVGIVLLHDYVKAVAGDRVQVQYSFDLSQLLPGNYVLGYSIPTNGGPLLEGIDNLIYIDVKPRIDHSELKSGDIKYGRMPNNHRGSSLLPIQMVQRHHIEADQSLLEQDA